MLHVLKRHPFPVTAHFGHCLVLTYAFHQDLLTPLLPPGLTIDSYRGYGFVALALVETRKLRPAFLPESFGSDFFLSGYRIFTRVAGGAGSLRGLRILASGTDQPLMAKAGNLFTHYNYQVCRIQLRKDPGSIEWIIRSRSGDADLDVIARLDGDPAPLPPGSPFVTQKDSRRFAGPLPYTFDYESETHSLIRIRGERTQWNPKPVSVTVRQNTFFEREPFCRAVPILANAFHLQDVPYRWQRGVRMPLQVN